MRTWDKENEGHNRNSQKIWNLFDFIVIFHMISKVFNNLRNVDYFSNENRLSEEYLSFNAAISHFKTRAACNNSSFKIKDQLIHTSILLLKNIVLQKYPLYFYNYFYESE